MQLTATQLELQMEDKIVSEAIAKMVEQARSVTNTSELASLRQQTGDALKAAATIHVTMVVNAFTAAVTKLTPLGQPPSVPEDVAIAQAESLGDLLRLLHQCLLARVRSKQAPILGGGHAVKRETRMMALTPESCTAFLDVALAIFRELSQSVSAISEEWLSPSRLWSPTPPTEPTKLQLAHYSLVQLVGACLHALSLLHPEATFLYAKKIFSGVTTTTAQPTQSDSDYWIIEHLSLNSNALARMMALFTEIAGNKKQTQLQRVIAERVGKAIWNWLLTNPEEFAAICHKNERLDAGNDALLQALFEQSDNVKRRSQLWPSMLMLLVITPEILAHVWEHKEESKKEFTTQAKFISKIEKAFLGKKGKVLVDTAARCYVDLCRACSMLPAQPTTVLHSIAATMSPALQTLLINPASPYKDSDNVTDIELIQDFVVASFRLDPVKTTRQILQPCLAPSSSPVMKYVVVSALHELAENGWNHTRSLVVPECLSEISRSLKLYFYSEYKKVTPAPFNQAASATSNSGTFRRGDKKDKTIDPTIDTIIVLLKFFSAAPQLALSNRKGSPMPEPRPKTMIDQDEFAETLTMFSGIITCATDLSHPQMQKNATSALAALFHADLLPFWHSSDPLNAFISILSAMLQSCGDAILFREHPDAMLTNLETAAFVLSHSNDFLALHRNTVYLENLLSQTYLAATARLECALLCALTSPALQVCTRAIYTMILLCEQCDLLGASSIYPVAHEYRRLSTALRVTSSRIEQQHVIRSVLRRLDRQTPGNAEAWNRIYQRWERSTPRILSIQTSGMNMQLAQTGGAVNATGTSALSAVAAAAGASLGVADDDAETKTTWQFSTHFLCAVAGVSRERRPSSERLPASPTAPLNRAGSIRGAFMTAEKSSPATVLRSLEPQINHESLIKTLLTLMVSEAPDVRLTAMTALGESLSPATHAILFQSLNSDIRTYIGDSGRLNISETATVYVTQAISVVRLILDQATGSSDVSFGDFESLVIAFAQYVSHLLIGDLTIRIRVKLVALVELLINKRNCVVFRNENRFRHQLIQYLMEWTSDFYLNAVTSRDPAEETKRSESLRLIALHNVDAICLRAIAVLTQGLVVTSASSAPAALQTSGTQPTIVVSPALTDGRSPAAGAKGIEGDDRAFLFVKYFTFLIRCHNFGRTQSNVEALHESTVAALTNLLNANIDSALDHFVTMGYHEDEATRASFLNVLTSNLKLRDFSTQEDVEEQAELDPYDQLGIVLTSGSLELVQAIVQATPITEADLVAKSLVRFFEAKGETIRLLTTIIENEVASTTVVTTLFRQNSMASKMVDVYSRLIGSNFLEATLGICLPQIYKQAAQYEVDPDRLGEKDNRNHNLARLEASCQNIVDVLCNSARLVPPPLRELFVFLSKTVEARFPGNSHIAVGGFLILRFFGPAVAAPETYGLMDGAPPISRRGLVLISKVLNNLANATHFREPFMQELDPFVDRNLPAFRAFLAELGTVPLNANAQAKPPPAVSEEDAMPLLHTVLARSLEPLRKVVQASPEQTVLVTNFDKLKDLLEVLGAPPELATKEDTTRVSRADTLANSEFSTVLLEDYLERNSGRNVEDIRQAEIFYQKGVSKAKRPVLYFIARRVKPHTDRESLLFFVLKMLQQYWIKPFEIVFDTSFFLEQHTLPASWCVKLWKLLPLGALKNLGGIFVVHPSTTLRSILRLSGRLLPSKYAKLIALVEKPSELSKFLEDGGGNLPATTRAIETEISASFSKVMHNKKEIAIRITSAALILDFGKDTYFGQLCTRTDVFDFAQIQEIVAIKGDEFSVKIEIAEGTFVVYVFSSTSAGEIIQAVKGATARRRQQQRLADIDTRTVRVFRPADLAGSLLNMAFLNLSSRSDATRLSAFNLLSQLCKSFSLTVPEMQLMAAPGLVLPQNSANFVVKLSTSIASQAQHLTMEFLRESFSAMKTQSIRLRLCCLAYLPPWIENLTVIVRSLDNSAAAAEKRGRILDLVTLALDISLDCPEIFPAVSQNLWENLAKEPLLVEMVLGAILTSSDTYITASGVEQACLVDITVSLNSNSHALGLLAAHFSKFLGEAQHSPIQMEDSPNWPKISLLLQLALGLSTVPLSQLRPHLPVFMHAVVLLSGTTASMNDRSRVHALAINIVSAISLEFRHDYIRHLLNELSKPTYLALFLGVDLKKKTLEKLPLINVERVASLFQEVLNSCASSSGEMVAECVAAWTVLAKATASRAGGLQVRGLITLGVIARPPADDELCTVLLRSLKDSLDMLQKTDASSSAQALDLIVATIASLSRLVPKLSPASRYLPLLPWLAFSLLQYGEPLVFTETTQFLIVSLKAQENALAGGNLNATLLETRRRHHDGAMHKILTEMDKLSGINWESSVSFSVATILLKGLTHAPTRPAALAVLSTLSSIATSASPGAPATATAAMSPAAGSALGEADSIGYVAAQMPFFSSENVSESAVAESFFVPAHFPNHAAAALFVSLFSAFLRSIDSETERERLFGYLSAGLRLLPFMFQPVFAVAYSWEVGYGTSESTLQPVMVLMKDFFAQVSVVGTDERVRMQRAMADFLGLQKSNTFQQITPSRNAAAARLASALTSEIMSP
eukprot:TRINITY_DN3435_c0_g1_i1.p1 TRINITY_DN3435_c0_g1~~TRINITY_DN3435_c0_g1_i1.p1  ORF type:complete len:2607 (+),score=602.20 TRINITY_DN3435_c0_g1_i1:1-7821(+)